MATPNRNGPCPCGSGRKYKECCGALSAPADLMAGVRLHQAGRLGEAEAIYRQVLQAEPANADALHMLGLAAFQQGRTAQAIELMEQAVRGKPDPFALNNLGAAYLAAGRPQEAADSFRRAAELKPDYGEALANLGQAMKTLGDLEAAAACYRRALAVDPANSRAHNNLGNVLRDLGRGEEAIACYRQALAAQPGNVEACNNLGVALAAGGQAREAIEAYRRALALRPDYPEAHLNLGNALRQQGESGPALASYREAVRLAPQDAAAWLSLANALKDDGQSAAAADGYRQVLRLDPGNAVAGHLLAAITGAAADRAPGQYVAGVFDQYADRFDEHLVDGLGYRVPEHLVARVVGHRPAPAGGWDVLDLGCGTGLAGVAVAPQARQLVGIDLSGRMLDKARERGIYQRLEQADLLAAMDKEPEAAYDLILAADVFVYLGRLDPVVARAACLLRPGGLLAFSVEALEALPKDRRGAAGFVLHEKGRFAHGADYLRRLAGDSGLGLVDLAAAQTRLEAGVPVQGWLVLMER